MINMHISFKEYENYLLSINEVNSKLFALNYKDSYSFFIKIDLNILNEEKSFSNSVHKFLRKKFGDTVDPIQFRDCNDLFSKEEFGNGYWHDFDFWSDIICMVVRTRDREIFDTFKFSLNNLEKEFKSGKLIESLNKLKIKDTFQVDENMVIRRRI